MTQAGVTAAVSWEFIASMVPESATAAAHPALAAHSVACEALHEFRALPAH